MDLQQKEATSPPTTEFNSYSTVSTTDSSSPERIINLQNATNLINLPLAQHMNRTYEVPDPNRIPQSVFARANSKSAPMEWSVTSNESLFSIHIAKSGELSNIATNSPEILQTGLSEDTIAGLKVEISGPLMEMESEGHDGNFKEKLAVNVSGNLNSNYNLSAMTTPCESPGSGIWGQHSETSTLSHNSFAFPVLTNDTKCKSLRSDSMHHLIMKEPSLPEQPLPETPISTKPAAPQNGSCFSCFHCCSFAR